VVSSKDQGVVGMTYLSHTSQNISLSPNLPRLAWCERFLKSTQYQDHVGMKALKYYSILGPGWYVQSIYHSQFPHGENE
jgi:hypothetical protein